jgi:hypothetical protein
MSCASAGIYCGPVWENTGWWGWGRHPRKATTPGVFVDETWPFHLEANIALRKAAAMLKNKYDFLFALPYRLAWARVPSIAKSCLEMYASESPGSRRARVMVLNCRIVVHARTCTGVFNTRFLGRPEIVDFWGLRSPGGSPNNHSRMRGASSPHTP